MLLIQYMDFTDDYVKAKKMMLKANKCPGGVIYFFILLKHEKGELPSLRTIMLEYIATNMQDRSKWPIEELYIPEEILEDLNKIKEENIKCLNCSKIIFKKEVRDSMKMTYYHNNNSSFSLCVCYKCGSRQL